MRATPKREIVNQVFSRNPKAKMKCKAWLRMRREVPHNGGVLRLFTLLALTVFAASAPAQSQSANAPVADAWNAMQSLAGQWGGVGGGQPGQASRGGFSFATDLQGAVLVRKSFAEFPASQTRPAFRHDDLTIVYRGAQGSAPHATYFDNERHVIEYAISTSSDGRRIEWLSVPQAGQPRFRLTYIFTSLDSLKLRFEIAAPGQLGKFSLYLETSARRLPH
jgi:hypothetical protein